MLMLSTRPPLNRRKSMTERSEQRGPDFSAGCEGRGPSDAARLFLFRQADELQQPVQIVDSVIFNLDAALFLPVVHGHLRAEMLAEPVLQMRDRRFELRTARCAARGLAG